MKVVAEKSMKYRALQRINEIPGDAVLRSDFADLGSPRQISRALQALVEEKKLARLGYGIYGKIKISSITGDYYLSNDFLSIVRESLTRLNVTWELSQAERDYNNRRTRQIPANPATKLLDIRFSRKLTYNDMGLRFE